MPHQSLHVVLNRHYRKEGQKRNRHGRLMDKSRIRIATWNLGTIMGKMMELVYTMIRRINIICWKEIKWAGEESSKIENTRYNIWYT